jgi:hypothetical protein
MITRRNFFVDIRHAEISAKSSFPNNVKEKAYPSKRKRAFDSHSDVVLLIPPPCQPDSALDVVVHPALGIPEVVLLTTIIVHRDSAKLSANAAISL